MDWDNCTLYMTVGLPRSGKSTWARKQGIPIVCPDAIRLAIHGNAYIKSAESIVWTVSRYMVISLFLAGHTEVILDATNYNKASRDEWILDPDLRRIFVHFDVSGKECKERAINDNKLYLLNVIDYMEENFELPDKSEKVI